VVDAGGVVVSGLAAGIDSEAHGAAGGQTIAVLGQGLLAPMPAWQCRVREAILADGGLVLSEFPPDAPAQTWTFPIRNRIIAGLAGAVVVVEAGQRSGARITARNALEYGREVLAVPGPLGAAASAGCLDLIEQGATMVRAIATVLQAARLGGVRPERAGAERDARVLAALGPGGTPEQVEGATGLDRRAVMAALGALELTGRVTRLPGRRYIPA
jgi:DNA processing protein